MKKTVLSIAVVSLLAGCGGSSGDGGGESSFDTCSFVKVNGELIEVYEFEGKRVDDDRDYTETGYAYDDPDTGARVLHSDCFDKPAFVETINTYSPENGAVKITHTTKAWYIKGKLVRDNDKPTIVESRTEQDDAVGEYNYTIEKWNMTYRNILSVPKSRDNDKPTRIHYSGINGGAQRVTEQEWREFECYDNGSCRSQYQIRPDFQPNSISSLSPSFDNQYWVTTVCSYGRDCSNETVKSVYSNSVGNNPVFLCHYSNYIEDGVGALMDYDRESKTCIDTLNGYSQEELDEKFLKPYYVKGIN